MTASYVPQPGYGYQQPAPGNQITRRPLTQAEKGGGLKFFKTMQAQLRVLALIPLILIVFNVLLLNNNYIVSLIALILSFIIIILSIGFLVFRKKVMAAMSQATAIEVRAPIYRSSTASKVPTYSVGPITLFSTPEIVRLVVEGAETSVVCIPQLKVALSVNGTKLAQGARIVCPPNLEAMARPAGQPHQQPMAPPPQQYPQATAVQPSQHPYYPPPPER